MTLHLSLLILAFLCGGAAVAQVACNSARVR